MPELSSTVSNTIKLFAGEPTTKWGVGVWGVDKWGSGGSIVLDADKLFKNTLAISATVVKDPSKMFSSSMSISSDVTDLVRGLGIFTYVYPSNTNDGNDQVVDVFTGVSGGSTTYSGVSGGSTTWSTV